MHIYMYIYTYLANIHKIIQIKILEKFQNSEEIENLWIYQDKIKNIKKKKNQFLTKKKLNSNNLLFNF